MSLKHKQELYHLTISCTNNLNPQIKTILICIVLRLNANYTIHFLHEQ